jgi:glycosyltransferase involved in cell wall biosynthesis
VNNGSLTIAHVLTSLSVGGGERVALLLARRQIELGHRVLVASLEADGEGELRSEFEDAGALVVTIPKPAKGVAPKLWLELAAWVWGERAGVVHTHNALPQIYGAPAGRAAGARVVHTEHGRHESSALQRRLRQITSAPVHRMFAVSEATADHVRQLGLVTEDRLGVILNGTDVGRFARDEGRRTEARGRWGVDDDAFVVGTVGRMAPVKNHALLIRAVAPLLGPRCRLVIAGDGERRGDTEALIAELGVGEHVHLLGTVRDVPAVMSGLDLFALSSVSEGLPMVLVEAMSASLPVVATDVGGVAKVVRQDETGLLVPSGDEQALREVVQALRDDRPRRERFAARACVVAEAEYSSRRMTDEYLAAYRG